MALALAEDFKLKWRKETSYKVQSGP